MIRLVLRLIGIFVLVPSFLTISTPFMYSLSLLVSILSILPSCFLNWPLIIFTLSPFFNPKLLFLCFNLRSFVRCALMHLRVMCNGALYLYSLCLLGCLLLFHEAENFAFILKIKQLCLRFLRCPATCHRLLLR